MINSNFILSVNSDGSQHSQYEDGDKPGSLAAPIISAIGDQSQSTLTVGWSYLAIGQTGFEIQRWINGVSSAWTTVTTSPGPDDRTWTDTTLSEGQYVGYRVKALPDSAWSGEAWGWTTAASPAPSGVLLYDDFEQYTVGQSVVNEIPAVANAAGIKWNWNSGSPVLVGTGGRNGGNCLHFNFVAAADNTDNTSDTGKNYCEQQLRLCDSATNAHTEIWVEFWLMTTDEPRVQFYNDKFCAMHNVNYCTGGRSAYGRQAGVANTWGSGNNRYGTITFSNYTEAGDIYDSWSHPYAGGGTPPYGNGHLGPYDSWWANVEHSANINPQGADQMAITPEQAGTWVRYRINYKVNTDGLANGHFYWWRNDVLLAEYEQVERNFTDYYEKTDGLYLLGAFNAGFENATTWKIDDVAVWSSDPGWRTEGTSLPDIFRSYDFTDATTGSVLSNTFSEFSGVDTALVSNEILHGTHKVCKDIIAPIQPGQQSYGDWGFTHSSSSMSLTQGDEVWFRVYCYFPSGYKFVEDASPNYKVKWMRAKTVPNGDYNDVYYQYPTQYGSLAPSAWSYLVEGYPQGPETDGWWILDKNNPKDMSFGGWHCCEVYHYLHSSSTSGISRFWLDGVQIGPDIRQQTLPQSSSTCEDLLYLTVRDYINGIDSQHHYWADVAIAINKHGGTIRDDTPYLDRDLSGNPFIGLNY